MHARPSRTARHTAGRQREGGRKTAQDGLFRNCRLTLHATSEEAFNKPVLLRGWVTPPRGSQGRQRQTGSEIESGSETPEQMLVKL